MPRLLAAFLWGVLAFIVTYVLVLLVVAVFNSFRLPEVATTLHGFAWGISLVAGLIYGWSHYSGLPAAR